MKIAAAIVLVALACANAASVKSSGQPKAGETVTINGVDYWIEHEAKTWNEADAHCAGISMQLVTLETEEKDIGIGQWLSDNDKGDINYWTGGNKAADTFVWGTGGAAFSYTRWYPGEPNDESWDICVLFQGRHGWHDYSCDYTYEFMCQPIP